MSIHEHKSLLVLEANVHRALLRGESASMRARQDTLHKGRFRNPWLIAAAAVAALAATSRWPALAGLIRSTFAMLPRRQRVKDHPE